MSREDFLARTIIKNMEPLEHARTTEEAEAQNPGITRKLNAQRGLKKVVSVAKTLGVGKSFTSPSGGVRQREPIHNAPARHIPTHHVPEASRPSGFSIYDFDPVAASNIGKYLKDIDGKGDPVPCDHDDR